MKKFINSNSKTYHHGAIESFSNTSKFLTSGLAKGHSTKEYAWVADLLFKNTGNLSLNPNVGYISFFSDKEIMYQEFGNVSEIYDAYKFFSYVERSIFASINFELDTKQYFKIGQRYSEFDLIEYINASDTIYEPVDEYRVNHEFYRAPVFHADGYKLNLDKVDPTYISFDQYLWSTNGYSKYSVEEYSIEFEIYSGLVAGDLTSYLISEYDAYVDESGEDPIRMSSYKLNVDNPKYTYFNPGDTEWVTYYNDTNHFQSGVYYPYIGSAVVYSGDNWQEEVSFIDSHFLFPQVIVNGILEPSKVITDFNSALTTEGRLSFNTGNHLNDSRDQSRVIYNACSQMFTDLGGEMYHLRRDYLDTILKGIDIDTERNRRYSAVVMTEPYFVVEPLGSGQLVEYSFVDENGDGADGIDGKRYLKVKAPLNIMSEIDSQLKLNDYNTDIINVLTIQDISPTGGELPSGGVNFYNEFEGVSLSTFYNRQDECIDDLVDGIVGTGNHRVFWMDPIGPDDTKYSDNKMKVCGLGVTWRESGADSKMDLNIYCTNYEPVNSPPPGTSETPVANDYIEFLQDPSTEVDVISGSEKFKPMIKLQDMNGYVKIMKKNTDFPVTRSSDGKYEVVYNVEFPYCPGSNYVRSSYAGESITGFIYKKKSYINAGSHEVDTTLTPPEDTRYNAINDRYAPYGDDSFSKIEVLHSMASDVITDPFNKGGGKENLTSTTKNQITYPGNLVFQTLDGVNSMLLTKPRFQDFKRYGTYELIIQGVTPTDIKTFCLVDNRQWKFNEDRFSSYIGYENPSYVFEIDASVISDDFSKYQLYHGSIPDTKRWLYGYFTGFSHVLLSQDLESTPLPNSENLSTMGNNSDLISDESKSDVIVEVWDQESDVGNSQTGNWRPFMSQSSDNHKIPGSVISDNIFITDVVSIGEDDISPEGFGDIYSAYIGYLNNENPAEPSFTFPTSIVNDNTDILNGEQNLVFYDTIEKISYHIAYIQRVGTPLYDAVSPLQQTYKIYFRLTGSVSDLTTIDIENLTETDVAQYQIRRPFKTLEKNVRFSTDTVRAVDGVDDGFLTRFIDSRGDGDPSDFERFFVDDKVYFRVRVSRGKKYPSSYESQDSNEIPYLGEGVIDEGPPDIRDRLNFPWYNDDGSLISAFDWAKVKTEETIRKFGLNYFKCASK